MHDIEPFWRWRDHYISEEDPNSPFYENEYSEFEYTHSIYNFFMHPQWDFFGSPALMLKILYADYTEGYAVIELIGEWNDLLHNDSMILKREVIDLLIDNGIYRFILIGENVLNFHPDEDDYYQEWYEDISEQDGWIAMVNFNEHVFEEMQAAGIHQYVQINERLNNILWRKLEPQKLCDLVDQLILKFLN